MVTTTCPGELGIFEGQMSSNAILRKVFSRHRRDDPELAANLVTRSLQLSRSGSSLRYSPVRATQSPIRWDIVIGTQLPPPAAWNSR